MTDWPTVRLSDVCTVTAGGTPSRANHEYFVGDIPWVKIGDMLQGVVTETEESITPSAVQNSAAKLLPAGTVLISIFATIGRTAVLGVPATTNQAIAGLTPHNTEELSPTFLRRWLDSLVRTLEGRARGVAQVNVNSGILRALEIPLPPIDEQRRIAAILDQADTLRAKRREALAHLDDLTHSIFLDMFGDPVTNPLGWPVTTLTHLGQLDRGVSRHRPRNDPSLLGGRHPLVQTGEVANSGGYIRSYTSTYSDLGLAQSKTWPAGTLCITIAANIAKTGILTFDSCFPDSVVGFTSDKETTQYVRVWLGFLQGTLERSAPQSAQKNINLAILRNLPVPKPPAEIIEEFAGHLERLEEAKNLAAADAQVLNGLFTSLQSRAFAGEL